MDLELLKRLRLHNANDGAYCGSWYGSSEMPELESINPSNGESIGRIRVASRTEYDRCVKHAAATFNSWRLTPPPRRGEIVRQIGQVLRRRKQDLSQLLSLEVGKIPSESEGEIQEMIDICDFATGLSRQLYGLTMASERPAHRLFEQWQPLGPIGIITAFNFPAAVWAWNAAIAAVCGDTMIWKPSPLSPLTAVAIQHCVNEVMESNNLDGVFNLCISRDKSVGKWMADDDRLPLISATGSCAMGRSVAQRVAARLGKSLLELGGNNGMIITESANLDLALRAVLFAAVGTAGQRCTTLRRLFLHEKIAGPFLDRLVAAYESIRIGDPFEQGVLVGPLIDSTAVDRMMKALVAARQQGARILCGGEKLDREGFFVQPTIVLAHAQVSQVAVETFAPILYAIIYKDLAEAIDLHNQVDQGLSSAIFTDRINEAETFLSAVGSDCGIANVNVGPSGAEIGGAFGGEKDTGGGREAGSDAWKSYMRRQTCTINFSSDLPMAQGVEFPIPMTGDN